jgi:hypothetical protein
VFEGRDAGQAIGDMLAGNTALTDLNILECIIDARALQAISKGVADSGATSIFTDTLRA